jgi:1,4-dihydroxy-6-naphthoate synthase
MKLSLGFSPCPNDTFIFDAMIHQKVDTEGLEFDVLLADVEELNQRAFSQSIDVTKLSYHAYGHLVEHFALLDAGSALGNKVGPLLIALHPIAKQDIPQARIAIPGKYTTANFLLSLAYPTAQQKTEMLFSDIENAVLQGQMDAGLIIHENRFTYASRGLVKLLDLGEYWEESTGLPIPLGGIVVNRQLPLEIQQKVNRVMARSVAFAQANPSASLDFVKAHAQEMEESVMYQHINLYVNNFTLDLGERGRAAIAHLFAVAREKGVIPDSEQALFVSMQETISLG